MYSQSKDVLSKETNFRLIYYKKIQLNVRVAVPYKIALFISFVGFALITGTFNYFTETVTVTVILFLLYLTTLQCNDD